MIRIKELRTEMHKSLRDVASELNISYSSLSKYERGDQQPSYETLMKMADYFNVSTDYIIGYTDIRTKNVEDKAITEKTGLTLRSIDVLSGFQKNAKRKPTDAFDTTPATCSLYLETLNKILLPSCNILENITYYLYLQLDYFYDDDTFSDEDLYKHISELGLFDKRLGISYCEDYDYLSQAFLLMVQKELMQLRNEVQQNIPKRITPIAEDDYMSYIINPDSSIKLIKELTTSSFSNYLENAIKFHQKVTYKDRYPCLIIQDFSIYNKTLTFFFSDGSNDTISLEEYKISQSKSIPFEFYFSKSNGEYFVLIFDS